MVRLKELEVKKDKPWIRDFNSTMVRLKDITAGNEKRRQYYFNSTMVRLKEYNLVVKDTGEILFQFHYGTIKSLTLEKISALIFKNLADTKL